MLRTKSLYLVLLLLLVIPAVASKRQPSAHPTNFKYPAGRHVCMQSKVVNKPVRKMETYCKPIYKSYVQVCEKSKNKLCTSFRVVYETAVRSVVRMEAHTESSFACCPGWTQTSRASLGCMQPVCSAGCKNGGSCLVPDQCICPPGLTGKLCDKDTNECESNPCHHKCNNTLGSFKCSCFEGFVLQDDLKTCKLKLTNIPEYKDVVENYAELNKRVSQLEKTLKDYRTEELEKRMEKMMNALSRLQDSVMTTPSPFLHIDAPVQDSDNTIRHQHDDDPWERINSLSDQMAILEEKLGYCGCEDEE